MDTKNKNKNKKKNIILIDWSCDVLLLILNYCHRPEQIELINLIFANKLSDYDEELENILDSLLINEYNDSKLIGNFNQKYYRNVLQYNNISQSTHISIYFNNIKLNGTIKNLNYLKSNKKSVIYAFLFYLTRKNELFKATNITNKTVEIDGFIEGFKKNKAENFDIKKAVRINDSKLDNIEYKNRYCFNQFGRINDSEIYNNLSWKQLNDIYMKNVIYNMLLFCGDDVITDNFDNINYGDNDIESLNILLAPLLWNELNAYCINSTISKHTSFLGTANAYNTFRKSKRTMITTSKHSHLCFFNWSTNNMSVITMMNKKSYQHIEDEPNAANSLVWAYVDGVFVN